MSEIRVNAIKNTGGVEKYLAQAWVNFQANTGTPTIRASGNVSSITDVGVGIYTINLTTAMPDANYSVVANAGASNDQTQLALVSIHSRADNADRVVPTTSAFTITTYNFNVGLFDPFDVNLSVFR